MEWSGKISPPPAGVSLAKLYDEIICKEQEIDKTPVVAEPIPSTPSKMYSFLEQKLEDLCLPNIILEERRYTPQTWEEMEKSHKEYLRLRVAFLKMIAYSNTNECLAAGLNNDDINLLKSGMSPENFNTHLKIPFDFGGTTDFNNFSLVKSHPTHDRLHHLIELQISTNFLKEYKKIFIPTFEGRIYHD